MAMVPKTINIAYCALSALSLTCTGIMKAEIINENNRTNNKLNIHCELKKLKLGTFLYCDSVDSRLAKKQSIKLKMPLKQYLLVIYCFLLTGKVRINARP